MVQTTSNQFSASTECAECPYEPAQGNHSAGLFPLVFITGLLSVYLFSRNKKKGYLIGGGLVMAILLSAGFMGNNNSSKPESAQVTTTASGCGGCPSANTCSDNNATTELTSTPMNNTSEDEFSTPGSEFTQTDEFSAPKSDEFSSVNDEFSTTGDEFSSTDEFSASLNTIELKEQKDLSSGEISHITDLIILAALMLLIGLLIQKSWFRKLRPLFLLGILVWLGFVNGGCPCMISSFQNTVLWLFGSDVSWVTLLWFLGLIPLTYFFGRIWCGWLCHLGGLQEFLFGTNKLTLLQSPKNQQILKYTQIGLLVVLLVQLLFTKSNLYIHYDPFKAAFNLFASNTASYILLVLLLASSLFIYRPFCRMACPVGLILGWISYIPGAKKLQRNNSCVDCISCSKACKSNAITYVQKMSHLDYCGCIMCGDCIESCKKTSITL